jgi:hypothetical protein
MSTPCDLDELKHQVREKAIAELKEYIEKDGAWESIRKEFLQSSFKSACGRFVATTTFYGGGGINYSLSYKDVDFWYYIPTMFRAGGVWTDEQEEKYHEENSEVLGLHTKASGWLRKREECEAHMKALGIEGHEWQPSRLHDEIDPFTIHYLPPDTHETPWVLLGCMWALGFIIGAFLL